jgi:hypothetical protein
MRGTSKYSTCISTLIPNNWSFYILACHTIYVASKYRSFSSVCSFISSNVTCSCHYAAGKNTHLAINDNGSLTCILEWSVVWYQCWNTGWIFRCTSHKVIFKNAKSLPGTDGSIPNSITPNYRRENNFKIISMCASLSVKQQLFT